METTKAIFKNWIVRLAVLVILLGASLLSNCTDEEVEPVLDGPCPCKPGSCFPCVDAVTGQVHNAKR